MKEEWSRETGTEDRMPDVLEKEMMHLLMRIARICSLLFRQTYYPIIAVFVLLNFTFLHNLSHELRMMVLLMVALYTLVLPHLICKAIDVAAAGTFIDRYPRVLRQVHYLVTFLGFVLCIFMLGRLRMPFFLVAYLQVAVVYQTACLIIGLFWNISTQSAAAASVAGCLLSYSLLMDYDATAWVCVAIVMNGLVSSSRVLMRRHTVAQTMAGSLVGLVSSLLVMFVF